MADLLSLLLLLLLLLDRAENMEEIEGARGNGLVVSTVFVLLPLTV